MIYIDKQYRFIQTLSEVFEQTSEELKCIDLSTELCLSFCHGFVIKNTLSTISPDHILYLKDLVPDLRPNHLTCTFLTLVVSISHNHGKLCSCAVLYLLVYNYKVEHLLSC